MWMFPKVKSWNNRPTVGLLIRKESTKMRVKIRSEESIIDDQITKAVSSAVLTVEKRMHDAILTAIDNMVIPRVQMGVNLNTVSTGHGTNSEV